MSDYEPRDGWEVVIGCEVHTQLATESKLFSGAPNDFGGEPNTRTTEVDLGMPGVLPVLNREALRLAVRAGLAFGCEIQPLSLFARKHYFYPDLPKGYQISQYEEPFAKGGAVPIELHGLRGTVPLTRIHMEEDAGKMIHDDAVTGGGVSHVDLNRAGVGLIEIVSEPAMHEPAEAVAYFRSLRQTLRWLGVSDCDMEKGNFRCDANVSVRRSGETSLGTRVELKNLNSFRFMEKAIAYEIDRQIDLIEDGGTVVQETRHWDERENRSRVARAKEDEEDYRYFPDPDLIPIRLEADYVEKLRAELPELPHARKARFESEYSLSAEDADRLVEDREVADFFEATARDYPGEGKTVANWMLRSVLGAVADLGKPLSELPLEPHHLVELLALVEAGKATASSAREIFDELSETGRDPAELLRERGLEALSDTGELEAIAGGVLDAHPEQVAKLKAGEEKLLNFLMGKVMRETRGKADPGTVIEVLKSLLGV